MSLYNKEMIMPISASQHRVSVGVYHNKSDNNLTRKYKQINNINNLTVTEDKIRFFGNNINRAINSFEVMSRSPYQNIAPRGITASLLMLLCHIRLPDNPLLIATGNPALVSDNIGLYSNGGNIDYSTRDDSYFGTILNPLAKALYDTGQFISRHDPLRFPLAEAAMMPIEPISHYEIQNENINNALFYELTGKNISDISPNVPVEPLIIFYPKKTPSVIDLQSVPAEINMDKSLGVYKEYLNEKCRIITKDNNGKFISNSVLVSSEVLDNIIKEAAGAVYKKLMGGNEMPPFLVDVTEKMGKVYDITFGVMTVGIYTSTKTLLLKSLKGIGFAIDGNKDCILNEVSRDELGRLMMGIEMGISDRTPIAPNLNPSKKNQGIDNPIYPSGSKKM